MRETLLFFGYMLGCLILAGALSYPIIHTGLLDEDPRRILGRIAQILMVLGLWPFLHWLMLDRRQALGFADPKAQFRQRLIIGWLLGSLIMGVIGLMLLFSGARVLEPWQSGASLDLLKTAARALLAGLLIATIEETFFRGALFSFLRQRHSLASAAAWSALLYALVHFMKPHDPPMELATNWAGIGWMLGSVFGELFDWRHLDSFAALWLAGVLLALLRERTGSIALGIGMHAGWVFIIQTSRHLTDGADGATWSWLSGDYDGVIGWLAAAMIALVIMVERVSAYLNAHPASKR